jgi:hypothetical protein
VVSLVVTSEEETHDNSKVLEKLVKGASENNDDANMVIADDGAYDSKKNFRYLSDNNIEAAIKVRRSSSGKANGCCYPRKLLVVIQ